MSRSLPTAAKDTPQFSTLPDRLRSVLTVELQGLAYREIANRIGMNHETVRRMFNGGTPSAEFLGGLCKHFHIDADWLLLNRGSRKREDVVKWALQSCTASDLLRTLACKWESIAASLKSSHTQASPSQTNTPRVDVRKVRLLASPIVRGTNSAAKPQPNGA